MIVAVTVMIDADTPAAGLKKVTALLFQYQKQVEIRPNAHWDGETWRTDVSDGRWNCQMCDGTADLPDIAAITQPTEEVVDFE